MVMMTVGEVISLILMISCQIISDVVRTKYKEIKAPVKQGKLSSLTS